MPRAPADGLLARLERSLSDAADAHDLVERVADHLRTGFDVARVSIRMLAPDAPFLVIVALWVDGPDTMLRLGQRMHYLGTSYADVLDRGDPLLVSNLDPTAGIPEQLLHADGIASYATLPLRPREHPAGLLSLSSRRRAAFGPNDAPLMTTIAAMVETTLDRLPQAEHGDRRDR